jgi:hypothetical protein
VFRNRDYIHAGIRQTKTPPGQARTGVFEFYAISLSASSDFTMHYLKEESVKGLHLRFSNLKFVDLALMSFTSPPNGFVPNGDKSVIIE